MHKIVPVISVDKERVEGALDIFKKEFIVPALTKSPFGFEFYTKFCKDAARYFSLTHEPCEYVYFFSYMPQYDQMTVSQMSYYLYWRDEVRKGNYIKTDINYLFLYIYEIINLPEKLHPSEGAAGHLRTGRGCGAPAPSRGHHVRQP